MDDALQHAAASDELCALQSAGMSVMATIPNPSGRVPATAASMISGARKARLSIDRTLRSLQPCRAAIACVSGICPEMSSSTQARAFAMPFSNLARVSARIGRAAAR